MREYPTVPQPWRRQLALARKQKRELLNAVVTMTWDLDFARSRNATNGMAADARNHALATGDKALKSVGQGRFGG